MTQKARYPQIFVIKKTARLGTSPMLVVLLVAVQSILYLEIYPKSADFSSKTCPINCKVVAKNVASALTRVNISYGRFTKGKASVGVST